MTPQELQMEAYKILVSMLQKDDELYWKRNEVLFTINGGFLTVAGLLQITKISNNPSGLWYMSLGLCFIGIIVCCLWFLINHRGEAFYNHWFDQLKYLEDKFLVPINVFNVAETFFKEKRVVLDESHILVLKSWFKRTRMFRLMQVLSILFAVIWFVLALYILVYTKTGSPKC